MLIWRVLAFLFEQLEHLHKLAEDEHLLALGQQRFEQFEQRLGLAGSGVVADQLRMAANLAQARERGQHMNLALVEAFFGDGLHDLFAAAAQFGQIKFPLLFAQFAIAPLLDAVRQIFGDVLLQAAQHERTQLGGKAAARDALRDLGVFAAAARRSRVKCSCVAEITRLDEIHDAPQIEQPIFQRRAGQRQALLGLQLLDRLRDLRAGVFDELRFVENHRAEREFLQLFQVAPQQRVIGDDEIVLRNLFAQVMPRRAAFQHQHFQMRREPFGFAPPVVQHGRRANDQRRLGILGVLLLQPRQPGKRLQRFAQAHVVGQNAAQLDVA